jgi:hypothetical protein
LSACLAIASNSDKYVNISSFDLWSYGWDEDEDTEVMGPPKKTRGATRKTASKYTVNMELESKRLDMERDEI